FEQRENMLGNFRICALRFHEGPLLTGGKVARGVEDPPRALPVFTVHGRRLPRSLFSLPSTGLPISSAASRARRSSRRPRFLESTPAAERSPRRSCPRIPSSPLPRGGVDRLTRVWPAHPRRVVEPQRRNPPNPPYRSGLSARPVWREA